MDRWIPKKTVAAIFNKTTRTISRWVKDPDLGFPQPADINGFKYFSEEQIEQFQASRMARGDAPIATGWNPPEVHAAIMPPRPPRPANKRRRING